MSISSLKEVRPSSASILFSDCTIAAQPIQALNTGSESIRPWDELLLRPGKNVAGWSPCRLVEEIYKSELGLGLDRLMVSLGCGWAARNPDKRVSINIHPRSLADEFFVRFALQRIESEGIEAEQVSLEVLESVCPGSVSDLVGGAQKLDEAGVLLGLDDFGKGRASMELAARLPIRFIKIDQDFVSGQCRQPAGPRVLAGLVAFANCLGVMSIAEGIETTEQLRLLTSLGVGYGQGHILGFPEAIDL